MPKLKTSKTASKRIAGVTKKGLIRVRKTSAQHLATNKAHRVRHNAAQTATLSKGDAVKVKRLVPYI